VNLKNSKESSFCGNGMYWRGGVLRDSRALIVGGKLEYIAEWASGNWAATIQWVWV